MAHILMAAWEYPGSNSAQGQALVRRIGQLVNGFLEQGHDVTFLYHDKKNEADGLSHYSITEGKLVRIAVPYIYEQTASKLIRKLQTLKEIATIGDFTGHWAERCMALLNSGAINIAKPDVIIAFSSPKGPIHLGLLLSRKYNLDFVVDFQDPYHEGTGRGLVRAVSDFWMKKTLKACSAISIINRFWAEELVSVYDGKINILDHAIPKMPKFDKQDNGENFIYYCGNINEKIQDIEPFMVGFDKYCEENESVYLKLSTNSSGMAYFDKVIKKHQLKYIRIKNTGWISINQVYQNMSNSWLLLLVALHTDFKKGIASKFYEYMAFDRPILITGNDSGAQRDYLKSHGHKQCVLKNAEQVYTALNDPSGSWFFKKENCGVPPLTETDLVRDFSGMINVDYQS